MKAFKKVTNKISNSKIIKNPIFLVIGLIAIILVIALIYFIFLKYSPIMNFKYEGYAISGKEITENLLGSSEDSTTNKNLELTKIEEQGTIFKKINDYFVGSKEKTEINLNYPIYINNNSAIYNLAESSTLISKDFEEIAGYPNLSISEGKVYDGNNLERADGKEYIFVKTADEIYINLSEIKIKTIANEYTIPVNSIIAFTENSIRYYTVNNNVLVFNQINDVDSNSSVQMVENNYTYEELLTNLGILQTQSNEINNENQTNIIQEDTTHADTEENQENEVKQEESTETNTNDEQQTQNGYIKPEVSVENFVAEVYTAKSTLTIKDTAGRIVEAPTFEIYKDGKIYLRRAFSNSGEIQITGLLPETEYKVIGKYVYLNESDQKVENTFYEGSFTTKGYDELGSIEITKENGEIYSNKIQLTKVKITSDIKAEVIKGINQVEIETGEIRTVLKNNQVNSLLRGEEITIESSEGLKSNSKIKYAIKFYDKNGIELKVNNNEGETRTSQEAPTARVSIKEQDIVSVTLKLNLTNRDNVKLENYKYVVTKPNGEVVKEEKLAENEKEILLEDLDQNQYYKIGIYADYDLNDNRGKQENKELGNLVFATQPISTLGSLELTVKNKELTSTTSTISYKIDEDRTDKRLIQILNELTINIKDGENIVETDILTGEEIENLQQAETKEIKYENLTSNTTYTIEITGDVQLGNTKESIPITYTYKEFTTLKIPAKVEIRNQFVTGNLIDFDVRIEDINNAVLNNKVRMELRNSKNDLIDLQEITTNEDYIRKTYEKLEENQTYKLSFYADQYNEGSTDATYKINYLIKEIEIVTEPGISGSIGLTELSRKATGKNLVDVSSDIKWYVYPTFNTNDYYGKEYNEATKILTLGGHSNNRRAVYDLREYAGQEVTMSFKAKAVSGSQTAYIQNSKKDVNRTQIQGLTTEWKDFQYTLTVDSTGYLGFYINGGNGIEIKELQIELGNRKTSYEEYKYTLQSNYSINLKDRRDEITTNDYYIKVYEDENLLTTDRYEEIPEENIITNAIKTYETQTGKQYKVELVIKIKDREYVLSELEYNTQDTEEIKGIYNKEDFLEIQQRGHYIVLGYIDLRGGSENQYRFGSDNMQFEGTIDFNGQTLIRDAISIVPIIYNIGQNGIIKNLKLQIYLNNETDFASFYGLFNSNYGKIENIKVEILESTKVQNRGIYTLGWYNYGVITNFAINLKVNLYGNSIITCGIRWNYGTVKNGYLYGKNIVAIGKQIISDAGTRQIGGIVIEQRGSAAKVSNVYSLINVEIEEPNTTNENIANVVTMNDQGLTENVYSVGSGYNGKLTNGPTIYSGVKNLVNNAYYFANAIFNNTLNKTTTKLALKDVNFQNNILNTENQFNVDELIKQGYYPQIKMPDCMESQEYIELPEIEDADLPDILYTEVLEQETDICKVKFTINNPTSETISKITLSNINCDIISQEYADGRTELIAELNNPTVYVSSYSITSITTKGAFNAEYTRYFENNERTINVDLYREVYNIDDWKNMKNSTTENYMLMNDLDFINESGTQFAGITFTGIINGNNHTIKNIKEANNVFNTIQGEVKNLSVENIELIENRGLSGINTDRISLISTLNGGTLDNIQIKNMKIKLEDKDSYISDVYSGALFGNEQNGGIVKNCTINNLTIDSDLKNVGTFYIGGIGGYATKVQIYNCAVTDLNIAVEKSKVVQETAGIVGYFNGNIQDTYAEGKISSQTGYVGGIVGKQSGGAINNTYNKVDIEARGDFVGGLISESTSSLVNLNNNIVLGNIYSSTNIENLGRIMGRKTTIVSNNNYAYNNQLINGEKADKLDADKLISIENFKSEEIFRELGWTAFDTSKIRDGILPKLYDSDTQELLPNQPDIKLEDENTINIEDIQYEKTTSNKVTIRLTINNPNNEAIQNVQIDNMEIEINKNIYQAGQTYIELTATPIKYYDSYMISKIILDNSEIDTQRRIDITFYKELYTYEDWQNIDKDSSENYMLMADIDFNGKINVNHNLNIGRLVSNTGIKTIKNIELIGSLFENISIEMQNISFDNIKIKNNNDFEGLISLQEGVVNNIVFKDITIESTKRFVGCISVSKANNISNITLENINIQGSYMIAGLIGRQYGTASMSNIEANDINIDGTGNYTAGLIASTESGGGTISNIKGKEISVISTGNYVGGLCGYNLKSMNNMNIQNLYVSGASYVGGISGTMAESVGGNNIIDNIDVAGKNENIGGLSGVMSGGSISGKVVIQNSTIKGTSTNSNKVGGATGYRSRGNIYNTLIKNTKIINLGNNTGGITGMSTYDNVIARVGIENTYIEGYGNVGGLIGNSTEAIIQYSYVNADITAEHDAGGFVGYLSNTNMLDSSNRNYIQYSYVEDSTITAKENVGGLFGSATANFYKPDTYYNSNYVEAYLYGNEDTTSILVGNNKTLNAQLNTHIYKYSTVNGQNIDINNEYIAEGQLLTGEQLKHSETYSQIIKNNWTYFDYTTLTDGKYPFLKSNYLINQEGVNLPMDEEHIVGNAENSVETQSMEPREEPEQVVEYNNKTIQTYSTYSIITAEDGLQATRNAKLYVNNNNLYAIPSVLSSTDGGEITPVANNLILDSYNGKDYETVLGSDGKIYDLKEPITYPENFVNSDIESIGNNLNSDVKEVEVTYKNGDKIKFNYQTGKIISSSKIEDTEKTGIFDYLKEKIAEIGNSNSEVSQEITTKYEESKELQTKLEETSVEEAIEKQNNSDQTENSVTTTENNVTNNSLKENKYISMYNEETGQYEIYNEEELLDTSKEEVVSENEKIEANNLSEYYASEGETKNTKMGIVWIVISIIGVGIILFVLRKNLKKKNA